MPRPVVPEQVDRSSRRPPPATRLVHAFPAVHATRVAQVATLMVDDVDEYQEPQPVEAAPPEGRRPAQRRPRPGPSGRDPDRAAQQQGTQEPLCHAPMAVSLTRYGECQDEERQGQAVVQAGCDALAAARQRRRPHVREGLLSERGVVN